MKTARPVYNRAIHAALKIALLASFFPALPLAQTPAELPVLALDNFGTAIRTQIGQAYNEAKAKPRDATIVGRLGMTLQAYEELPAAMTCYERARALAPNEFRWIYYLGTVQATLGQHNKASETFRLALQRHPEYLPAKIKLADALFALKKLAEAETLYAEATKNNPASALAWYGLGRVKAAQQDTNAAVNAFERAVTLSPQFGAAHYALAMALRDAGRIGKAKEHLALYQQNRLVRPRSDDVLLEEVAALNYAQFHLNRGLAFEAEGDLKNSIIEHEKVLAINPAHIQAHVNLIQLYSRTNQAEKAEQHYRQALALNPNYADAHYNFGVLLASQGKLPEATQAFTRALAINPTFAEAHHNLGLLLLQAAKLDEAMPHFQAAIASKPVYRQARFELGRILVNKGQLAEAIQHFEQTLTPEDHETPRYLYALAATYVRAGQREKGLEYIRRAKDKAISWGQKELLAAIERDLKVLEQGK